MHGRKITQAAPVQSYQEAAIEHTRELIRATIDEIGRADSKAALLLTGGGVVLSAATSALAADAPHLSRLPLAIAAPLLVAALAIFVALIALGAATYPRGVHGKSADDKAILYFADVLRFREHMQLQLAVRETLNSKEETTLRQLMSLARITQRKYFYIRIALTAFLLMMIAIIECIATILYMHQKYLA